MGCGSGGGGQAASFVSSWPIDLPGCLHQLGQLLLRLFACLGFKLLGSGTVSYDILVCHRACDILVLFQGSEHHWQARGSWDGSRASCQVAISLEPCQCHLLDEVLSCND